MQFIFKQAEMERGREREGNVSLSSQRSLLIHLLPLLSHSMHSMACRHDYDDESPSSLMFMYVPDQKDGKRNMSLHLG